MVQLSSIPEGQAPPLQTCPVACFSCWGVRGSGCTSAPPCGHRRLVLARPSTGPGQWSELRVLGIRADRSSLSLLLDLNGWINLLLRVGLRLLALVGVPFLLIGLRASGAAAAGRSPSAAWWVLLCTVATMRSSTIHEYYQPPLLPFSSPLIGAGWQSWHQQRPCWQPRLFSALLWW